MQRNHAKERLRAKDLDALSAGEHQDGGGLILRVEAHGRRWVQRITINGRRVSRGLGPYPLITLQDARDKSYELRKAAREGRDMRSAKETFAQAFEKHWAERKKGLKNKKHIRQWEAVRTQAFPRIGNRPVAEVTHDEIVAILSPMWRETPETARRLLQRLDIIFDIAISRGIREKFNPCTGVARNLGKQGDRVEHHRSLPWKEVPAFIRQLRACSATPITKLAFEFLILTAARSAPVRLAEPQEIDWDARLWKVPLPHMKGEQPHEVPLADRAIEILRTPGVGVGGLLFPGRHGGPLSDMSFTEVLKRMGLGDRATAHGFRSSFRTWTAETNACRPEVAEAALAHVVKNKVEAAYRRATYLEERTTLMSRWAAHCA